MAYTLIFASFRVCSQRRTPDAEFQFRPRTPAAREVCAPLQVSDRHRMPVDGRGRQYVVPHGHTAGQDNRCRFLRRRRGLGCSSGASRTTGGHIAFCGLNRDEQLHPHQSEPIHPGDASHGTFHQSSEVAARPIPSPLNGAYLLQICQRSQHSAFRRRAGGHRFGARFDAGCSSLCSASLAKLDAYPRCLRRGADCRHHPPSYSKTDAQDRGRESASDCRHPLPSSRVVRSRKAHQSQQYL